MDTIFPQLLMLTALPAFESAGAALLFRPLALGALRDRWRLVAGFSIAVMLAAVAACTLAQTFSPVIVERFVRDGTEYVIPYHSVQVYFAVTFGLALVAGALLLAVLRWQTGGWPRGIGLLAVSVLCAEMTFAVKFWGSGWLILPEIFTGVAVAIPVIHVLLRVALSSAPQSPRLLIASLGSDLVLIAATLLRFDAGDGPPFVYFEAMFGPALGPHVPPWLGWLTSQNGVYYNFALYVPVVVSWFVLMRVSHPRPSPPSPQPASAGGA